MINTTSSKVAGGPSVIKNAGFIKVRQTQMVGWFLLAFGLGLPMAVFLSETRFRKDPWAYLGSFLGDQGLSGIVGFGLMSLFFGALTVYGLFWLLWTRHLTINTLTKTFVFRTGIWPFIKQSEGACLQISTVHLWRKIHRPQSQLGGEPTGSTGSPVESWEVRLDLPGSQEPLFLGEWGLRDDAIAEIKEWQGVFPNLIIDEHDLHPML